MSIKCTKQLSLTTGGLSGQREEENIAAQTNLGVIGIIMEPNIGYRVATGHGEPLDNTYEYIQTIAPDLILA